MIDASWVHLLVVGFIHCTVVPCYLDECRERSHAYCGEKGRNRVAELAAARCEITTRTTTQRRQHSARSCLRKSAS
uniref:Putative secreted protein n=1 Tax=Ixodes ricinus TaxID=34613 RepID=A0A6B0TTX2_IXORI